MIGIDKYVVLVRGLREREKITQSIRRTKARDVKDISKDERECSTYRLKTHIAVPFIHTHTHTHTHTNTLKNISNKHPRFNRR